MNAHKNRQRGNEAQPEALALNYGSRTDVGRVREQNEDSLLVREPLFVVADGMGGHEAGEVASELAVNTMDALSATIIDGATLKNAIIQSNRAIINAARTGVGRPGMGTTMTTAYVTGTTLFVGQVGDSRAYLLHGGILQQITHDHSLMAELIEAGQITEEEARVHPNRSIITRALGNDPATEPDIFELTVEAGDRLLLCSDGLSGLVEDDELLRILQQSPDPQRTADLLVAAANANGGHDNITAIVVDVAKMQPLSWRKRNHSLHASILAFVIVLVLLCGVAVGGIYLYARNSAYLIAENGTVQVYRGLVGSMAGISLSWYVEDSGVNVAQLAQSTEERLATGIQCDSLEAAQNTVDDYRTQIDDNQKLTAEASARTESAQSTSTAAASAQAAASASAAAASAQAQADSAQAAAASTNG